MEYKGTARLETERLILRQFIDEYYKKHKGGLS